MTWTQDSFAPAEAQPFGHERKWLLDAGELLAEPDPGPTPWLIEGLIVDRALVACVGRWKTTKSYALLDLCIAIATGRPAFGALEVPEPGPVIFVNEESGRAALWRRLDALCRGRGIDPSELRGRLYVGANARVRLDDSAWQTELLAMGLELRPRLFAFDPLARMKAALRAENEQTGMAPVFEFWRELREQTGAAVALVHHTGHQGAQGRGTSDFETVWETRLTWTREKQAAVVKLENEHREAEASDPITYRICWDADTRSMRFELQGATSGAAAASALEWILEHVNRAPGQPRGEVETAFANHHGKGGRDLARTVIAGELAASTSRLAKGPGKSPNGTYLYPPSELNSRLANPQDGESRETVDGAIAVTPTRELAAPLRGGRIASGEQPGEEEPRE